MSVAARVDHDVAIVGGGPAGASTALHLVRVERVRPDRIVIVDKARFPRDKPCAGAVSQLGVDVLRDVGVELTVPFVAMQGVRVITNDGIGETRCAMGIVTRRIELDAQLLEEVKRVGVRVHEGEGLVGLERAPFGFRLVTPARTLTARLVAACDGAGSATRKLLGLGERARKGHLYVTETPARPEDTGTRRGLIDFDLTVLDEGVTGYYWDFPTVVDGAPAVSRGIYHVNLERTATPPDVKGVLARALARRGVDIATCRLKPFSTRPYVKGSIAALPGVLLVGEAAGIDHATGEGIAQALVMGRMAARHAARALRTGGVDFEAYARELHVSTVGRHMRESAWLARRVYGRLGGPARRLLTSSDYARSAAMRWYHGESLSIATKARLGASLLAHALA